MSAPTVKGFFAALGSSVLIVVVLVAIDVSMRVWPSDEPPMLSTRSIEYVVPSESLGWMPLPSTVARVTKTKGGQIVYDVTYAFDEHSRRIVPQDPSAKYDEFLLFFGDSNAFGEGVDARASLPYQTASRLSGVRAYNYAFHGYGPQHMLAKLQSTDMRVEINEPGGLVLYVYLGFLIDRLLGGSHTMSWAGDVPYYTARDGSVERAGFYQTTRPIYSFVMRQIGGSPLLNRLNVRWPMRVTDTHRDLFCRLMAAARDEVRRQLPGSDLVIVLHPKAPVPLFQCFKTYGLRIVDIRRAYGDTPRADLAIPVDLHASARADELAGTALARELEQLLRAQRD